MSTPTSIFPWSSSKSLKIVSSTSDATESHDPRVVTVTLPMARLIPKENGGILGDLLRADTSCPAMGSPRRINLTGSGGASFID
jgi:hypothetical protein